MKEFFRSILADMGKDAVNKAIMWIVICTFATVFVTVGVIYVKKSSERQLKKAVIEVKTMDAEELGEKTGKAVNDLQETGREFLRGYKSAKDSTKQ